MSFLQASPALPCTSYPAFVRCAAMGRRPGQSRPNLQLVSAGGNEQGPQQQQEQPKTQQQLNHDQLLTWQQAAAQQAEDRRQRLQQQFQQQLQGYRLQYQVPWDIWTFIEVSAAVWVINMAIPFAVMSAAAHLQGTSMSDLPLTEKGVLGLMCQCVQLGVTWLLISQSTKQHQPLPRPWFLVEVGTIPVLQGLSTAVAAIGSGVLLSGFMTGHSDGSEEWRHLAGLGDVPSTLALVVGALVMAPVTEEYFFRGYVLPSLTKWLHPAIAVLLTGLFFASAHPSDAFFPEALLGIILSVALLAGDGNLIVPLLAHFLYNTFVLGVEFVL